MELASESWPPLHMKDFAGAANKKGWDTKKREEFLQKLTGVLHDQPIRGVVVAVDLQAYLAMRKSHKKLFKSAQSFAMTRAIMIVIRNLKHAGISEPLQIVIDQDYQYAKERLEYYLTIRKQRPWLREYFTAITFADARCFPLLQAADLLVWTARREIQLMEEDPSLVESRFRKICSLGKVEKPEIWTAEKITAEFARAANEVASADEFARSILSVA